MTEPDTRIRASDADRHRIVARLEVAHAEGRIGLAEFDERARLVWASETYGDLAGVTADLPQQPSPPARTRERAPSWRRVALRTSLAAWVLAVAVNVLIWALVSLGKGEPAYPWWIWVAGPWGAFLLVSALAGRFGAVRQCSGRRQR